MPVSPDSPLRAMRVHQPGSFTVARLSIVKGLLFSPRSRYQARFLEVRECNDKNDRNAHACRGSQTLEERIEG